MTTSALLFEPPTIRRPPGAAPIIRARGLTRRFPARAGVVEAVCGLDLDVAEGELVALLGPDGAGKSTSLRMLTTLLRPTAGEATVVGHDILRDPDAVRRRTGYVGQGNGAAPARRVRDELVTQGRCFGIGAREATTRADELLAALDLEPLAERKASALSGGQRRRLDVAIGLVQRPPLLFLDEPSTGLDPQSRADLWEHILRLRAEHGMTVFFTTQHLDEAGTIADRVMVMDHGRVVADDTAHRLKADLTGDRIVLGGDDPVHAEQLAAAAREVVGVRAAVAEGATVRVRVADAPAMVPLLLYGLAAAGLRPRSTDVRRPTLDDVLPALTGRNPRETQEA